MRRFFGKLGNALYEACGATVLLTLITLGACALYTKVAHATGTTAHVAVTLPTQYTDDTPLPASDIAEIHIQWFRPGATAPTGEQILPPTQLSVDIPNLACGNFRFAAFVRTTSTAAYPSLDGDSTNPVPYTTGVTCRPKAPPLTVS